MAQTTDTPQDKFTIRRSVATDRQAVLDLVDDTKFFRPDELEIAREVLDEAIAKGAEGHYQSFVADVAGLAVGWVCWGPTPCTLGTFDVYWLAVSPKHQGLGLGRALMKFAEDGIFRAGGRLSIVETAGREEYVSTRLFYERVGYHEAARVKDFYSPGDDKIIYVKYID